MVKKSQKLVVVVYEFPLTNRFERREGSKIKIVQFYYRKKVMDVNGQNGKPMLNGASNGGVHHITDNYHEKNGYATNIQTNLPGGKEELINNFQMKIGQDMDLGTVVIR